MVLAFFVVSCPACQYTFPFLERLAAEGVCVAGISQDDEESTELFRRTFKLQFPLLLDSAAAGYPVSDAFGIQSVPSIFLIDDNLITLTSTGFHRADLVELGHRLHSGVFRQDEETPDIRPGCSSKN